MTKKYTPYGFFGDNSGTVNDSDFTIREVDADNTTIWMNNNSGSAKSLFIPSDAQNNLPVESVILIMSEGADSVSIIANAGVTLNGIVAGVGALSQYVGCTLVKRGANLWVATPLTVS